MNKKWFAIKKGIMTPVVWQGWAFFGVWSALFTVLLVRHLKDTASGDLWWFAGEVSVLLLVLRFVEKRYVK